MIYFDNSATTPIYPEALNAYVETSRRVFGNPSSLHGLGSTATRLLTQSRKQIADLLGVLPSEIYFTSGATEGDNWAIKGTALEKRSFGRHILLSAIEHPAVMESGLQLQKLGFEVEYLPVDKQGLVLVEELAMRIRKETILVSVLAVNNEIGSRQKIREISALLADYPQIHFHVDAVQAIGKCALPDFLTPRVNFAAFSAHKFHGPRGVGFLYVKEGTKFAPLLSGGGQEMGLRATTENLPTIVSMAKALRMTLEDFPEKRKHVCLLRDTLYTALENYEKVTLFSGNSEDFAPHILTFGLKRVRGEVLVHAFEEKQIFLSTTSACSSKKKQVGSTLEAMNVPRQLAETAVRLSLDALNTLDEVEQFLSVFQQLYTRFEKINA